jgi:hypothetical protein
MRSGGAQAIGLLKPLEAQDMVVESNPFFFLFGWNLDVQMIHAFNEFHGYSPFISGISAGCGPNF